MKIAILTSGGDAPGMNAAIRAVVRYGSKKGYQIFGVRNGFYGLYKGDFIELSSKDVSGIISRGGTILRTTRFPEFSNEDIKKVAADNLLEANINHLIVIGGNGSFAGANSLGQYGINIIGIPGTIDNDIYGTDFTIGFSTALNTIVEAIDKLRDTSVSHQRCSIIEVMGRDCGDLALHAAISGGAEFLVTPEHYVSKEAIIKKLRQYKIEDRTHAIIVVTEKIFDVAELAKEISLKSEFSSNATTLGYVQRGGAPVPFDRMLASRMGKEAINIIADQKENVCLCIEKDVIITLPIEVVVNNQKTKNPLYKLIDEIS